MKIFFVLSFVFLFGALNIFAQDVTGSWKGGLNVQGTQLTIVFNISKNDSGLISTLDVPEQGAKEIPANSTIFEKNVLTIKISAINAEYVGELKDSNIIEGNFKQGGLTLPLNLTQSKGEVKAEKIRPQEPKPPFPYKTENVKFQNPSANLSLAGTLTLPSQGKNFPVVILISGSGPQNRDEELLGHKPFLVLADYLTRNGIAVLRYDDRGVGESTGDFKSATSQDFAVDAESAITYLKTRPEIDKKKIGLVGHSEGGIIAPMVAAKSKDVAFIVLLAGTGVSGDEVLLSQKRAVEQSLGLTKEQLDESEKSIRGAYEIVKEDLSQQETEKKLVEYFQKISLEKSQADSIIKTISSPWMLSFIKYQPSSSLIKVHCPVLALNGEKDLQVLPKLNLPAIEESLAKGGNKKVTIKELPQLNHLFQECKTCLLNEYGNLEQTFSPLALEEILTWIKKQTK